MQMQQLGSLEESFLCYFYSDCKISSYKASSLLWKGNWLGENLGLLAAKTWIWTSCNIFFPTLSADQKGTVFSGGGVQHVIY